MKLELEHSEWGHSIVDSETHEEVYLISNPAQAARLLAGWDIFNIGNGQMQVQRDDELNMLADDDAAIALARAAGVKCDDDGNIIQ